MAMSAQHCCTFAARYAIAVLDLQEDYYSVIFPASCVGSDSDGDAAA